MTSLFGVPPGTPEEEPKEKSGALELIGTALGLVVVAAAVAIALAGVVWVWKAVL